MCGRYSTLPYKNSSYNHISISQGQTKTKIIKKINNCKNRFESTNCICISLKCGTMRMVFGIIAIGTRASCYKINSEKYIVIKIILYLLYSYCR